MQQHTILMQLIIHFRIIYRKQVIKRFVLDYILVVKVHVYSRFQKRYYCLYNIILVCQKHLTTERLEGLCAVRAKMFLKH